MIVIAIIGILAAIAIPQYEKYIASSEAADIAQDTHQAITESLSAVAAAQAGQTTVLIGTSTGVQGSFGIARNTMDATQLAYSPIFPRFGQLQAYPTTVTPSLVQAHYLFSFGNMPKIINTAYSTGDYVGYNGGHFVNVIAFAGGGGFSGLGSCHAVVRLTLNDDDPAHPTVEKDVAGEMQNMGYGTYGYSGGDYVFGITGNGAVCHP